MKPTEDRIRSMTPEQRCQLYENAKRLLDKAKKPLKGLELEAEEIVDFIDREGLPLSSGGLTLDHPIHQRIVELVWSKEGRRLAEVATKEGIPALCGVDQLLQRELGDQYSKYDLGTASAGAVVAEVMRNLGYIEDGQGVCPDGCRAKSGLKWRPRLG